MREPDLDLLAAIDRHKNEVHLSAGQIALCGHPDCRRVAALTRAQPFTTWHDDDGPVLWWRFPIREPPHAGTPSDSDWPFDEAEEPLLGWTRLVVPRAPEDLDD